jgi:hypothetical protein
MDRQGAVSAEWRSIGIVCAILRPSTMPGREIGRAVVGTVWVARRSHERGREPDNS